MLRSAQRDILLSLIFQEMKHDKKVIFVTADFGSPVLSEIEEVLPGQIVNVGIAEQNLINVSAGLAIEGFKVYCYAIAPFITMRCFEQIRVNCALLSKVRKMDITLIGVGVGYSYSVSGPTHQCYEDLGIMRNLPTLRIFSPSDDGSITSCYRLAKSWRGINYFRLDAKPFEKSDYAGLSGDALIEQSGLRICTKQLTKICIISTGYLLKNVLLAQNALASEGIQVNVIEIPVFCDGHLRASQASMLSNFEVIFTAEEGFLDRGGLDSYVRMLLNESNNKPIPSVFGIGVEPTYRFEIGDRDYLHELSGISVSAITKKVSSKVNEL